MTAAASIAETQDREIVITRVFDAPPSLVFDVWTDPAHIAQWWGPKGFTTTVSEMDVRVGGVWRFVMHGPDGVDYPSKIIYKEVVRPERLAYTYGDDSDEGSFQASVSFAEQGGKTEVILRLLFDTAEERDRQVREIGAIEGGNQTLDRFGEQLDSTIAERAFTITRTFDAPRDLVFQAWSEADRLAQWWGPKGFRLGVAKLDFRPGGLFHYSMRSPEGHEMWGLFVYREIDAPERLVFVNSFSDETGNIVRAPFSQTWPLEILNTLKFSEQEGKTTLAMRGIPVDATEEEYQTFRGMFESMQQGFKGTLDQLDEYLANAKN